MPVHEGIGRAAGCPDRSRRLVLVAPGFWLSETSRGSVSRMSVAITRRPDSSNIVTPPAGENAMAQMNSMNIYTYTGVSEGLEITTRIKALITYTRMYTQNTAPRIPASTHAPIMCEWVGIS